MVVLLAYKRYVHKKGKKHGPYYYKNVRDHTGKVRTVYLGKVTTRGKKPLEAAIVFLVALLIIISALFFIQNRNLVLNKEAAEKSKVPFEADQILIKVLVKENEYVEKELRVMNVGEEDISVTAESSGVSHLANIVDKEFAIKPGQTKIVRINFTSFDKNANVEQEPGVYIGKVIAKAGSYQKEIPLIVEIESKNVLFDMNLNPVARDRSIVQGDSTTFEIRVFNLQSIESYNVGMEFFVKDTNGNTIVSEKESVVVQTQASFFKTLKIPEKLKTGNYVFVAQASLGKSVGTASYLFEIESSAEKESRFARFFGFCKNDPLCWSLSAVILLLIFSIGAYAYFFVGVLIYEKLFGAGIPKKKPEEAAQDEQAAEGKERNAIVQSFADFSKWMGKWKENRLKGKLDYEKKRIKIEEEKEKLTLEFEERKHKAQEEKNRLLEEEKRKQKEEESRAKVEEEKRKLEDTEKEAQRKKQLEGKSRARGAFGKCKALIDKGYSALNKNNLWKADRIYAKLLVVYSVLEDESKAEIFKDINSFYKSLLLKKSQINAEAQKRKDALEKERKQREDQKKRESEENRKLREAEAKRRKEELRKSWQSAKKAGFDALHRLGLIKTEQEKKEFEKKRQEDAKIREAERKQAGEEKRKLQEEKQKQEELREGQRKKLEQERIRAQQEEARRKKLEQKNRENDTRLFEEKKDALGEQKRKQKEEEARAKLEEESQKGRKEEEEAKAREAEKIGLAEEKKKQEELREGQRKKLEQERQRQNELIRKQREEARKKQAQERKKLWAERKKKGFELLHHLGFVKTEQEKKEFEKKRQEDAKIREAERKQAGEEKRKLQEEKQKQEEAERKKREAEKAEGKRRIDAEKKKAEEEKRKQLELEAKRKEEEKQRIEGERRKKEEESIEQRELEKKKAEQEKRKYEEEKRKSHELIIRQREEQERKKEEEKNRKLEEISSLEGSINNKDSGIAKLKAKIDEGYGGIKSVGKEISAKEKDIEGLQNEKSMLFKMYNDSIESKKELSKDRENKIAEWKQRYNAKISERGQLESEAKQQYENSLKELEDELNGLSSKERNEQEKWKKLELKAKYKIEEQEREKEVQAQIKALLEEKKGIEEETREKKQSASRGISERYILEKQNGINDDIRHHEKELEELKKKIESKELLIEKNKGGVEKLEEERDKEKIELLDKKKSLGGINYIHSLFKLAESIKGPIKKSLKEKGKAAESERAEKEAEAGKEEKRQRGIFPIFGKEEEREIAEEHIAEQEEIEKHEEKELQRSIEELEEFEQQIPKEHPKEEKKPGLIASILGGKEEKYSKEEEKIKRSIAIKRKGKSWKFVKCHKLLLKGEEALGKKDAANAKRLYLKARKIYISLEYHEKKDVYNELNELYEKLSKAA